MSLVRMRAGLIVQKQHSATVYVQVAHRRVKREQLVCDHGSVSRVGYSLSVIRRNAVLRQQVNECKYRVIQKDGLNFVRLYFLNYT